MFITYRQFILTPDYILGSLNINGDNETYDTVQATRASFPGSLFRITLFKTNQSAARVLGLVPEDFDYDTPDANDRAIEQCVGTITHGHSYRDLKAKAGLLVGVKDFPGSITQSRKIYNRIVDRIEKALARHEIISFGISQQVPVSFPTHPYWLGDPKHGCPPSTLHCEDYGNGDVHVYNGNDLIRTHTLEEQKHRYQSSESKTK